MLTLTAAALVLIAIFIVVPAPTLWLLPLAIGAPEVSPVLLALALIVLLLSLRKLRSRQLAVVLSLVAAGLSAIPISKVSAVQRDFDRELARVFPAAAGREPPADARARPFVVRDLFLGIGTGDVRIDRGLQFAAPAGTRLVLDVYRPSAPGQYPIIVQIYGGGWQRGTRTDNETFARYFASRGSVVVATEYRHAPRFQWPAALDDVRAAIAWAAANGAKYNGDPSRLAVIGHWSGGHLGLLAAYTGNAPVAAVVSYYGPTDLTQQWVQPPDPDPLSVRGSFEALLGGTPETMVDRYRQASPVTYASAGAPPTLLIHGTRDQVVPPAFARELHGRLQALGARSLLLELPWAGHAFDTLPNGLSGQMSIYYTEKFLAAALARGR